ncbi:MAG: hypothetical protein LDLANPLL_01858 [Turneriella sp.]|nr:hypothetical protein [Turneriella sp.]
MSLYFRALTAVFIFIFFAGVPLYADVPKTDVVIEMADGALLNAEYISENIDTATVDIRAVILPEALCSAASLPEYLPKRQFKNPKKFSSGHCLLSGKPFLVRKVAIPNTQIAKRHDTTLLTLSASGENTQSPYFGVQNSYAWGYNFSIEQQASVAPAPRFGIQGFPLNATMETIQTVDLNGKREVIYPSQNIFAKWLYLDPRVALYYTPLLPTGSINQLNFGPLGFTLENSVEIPDFSFLPLKKYSLRLRAGINVGYHSFSQEVYQNNLAVADGSISLIPVLFQATLLWDLKPKNFKMVVSPYLRIADGIVFSSVKTQLKDEYIPLLTPASSQDVSRSGSYIGNGFKASLGIELRPISWPVAFILDAGYFIHNQDQTGSFFLFNAGISWYYGKVEPETKPLPIRYIGGK